MDNSYKGIYKGFYKKRARKNERQALWTVEARTAIPPTLSRDPSGVRFALSPAGEECKTAGSYGGRKHKARSGAGFVILPLGADSGE